LGLSEETDAPIVIVSEESGTISYAYKGQLVRGVTVEELRSFLTSVIVHAARNRGIGDWLRSLQSNTPKSGPAVINRNEPRSTPHGGGK